jgi:hypothetical protein
VKTKASRNQWLMPVIAYSRVRDQEDHGSKLARANSSGDPISKISKPKKRLAE